MIKMRLHQTTATESAAFILWQQAAIDGLRHASGMTNLAVEQHKKPTAHVPVLEGDLVKEVVVLVKQLVLLKVFVTLNESGSHLDLSADLVGALDPPPGEALPPQRTLANYPVMNQVIVHIVQSFSELTLSKAYELVLEGQQLIQTWINNRVLPPVGHGGKKGFVLVSCPLMAMVPTSAGS